MDSFDLAVLEFTGKTWTSHLLRCIQVGICVAHQVMCDIIHAAVDVSVPHLGMLPAFLIGLVVCGYANLLKVLR
jgi:hypothetical protein